jgi:hypothetical protein
MQESFIDASTKDGLGNHTETSVIIKHKHKPEIQIHKNLDTKIQQT